MSKFLNLYGWVGEAVESSPLLKRGLVHCHHCGSIRQVDSRECLRSGWLLCCGETMSLDSVAERKVFTESKGAK